MRKIMLLLLFVSTLGTSQERFNEIRVSLSKPTGSLKNIIGWQHNEFSGKWIKQKNNAGTYMCNELTFRNIIINEKKYYVLTISEIKGYYTYPTIKQDWHSYNSYRSYILEEPEFKNFKSFQNATSKYYEINTLEDESLQDYVYSKIKSGTKADLNFTFQLKKENDKIVRFIMPFEKGYEFLSNDWGFDKCYFEVSLSDFELLTK